jgi:hypothetical protein
MMKNYEKNPWEYKPSVKIIPRRQFDVVLEYDNQIMYFSTNNQHSTVNNQQ